MQWTRPIGNFPKIWYRFQAKDKNSDELVTYVVQDMPETMYAEAIQFMLENFIPDEPLCSGTDLLNDPVSCQEMNDFWYNALKQKMTLVCFKDGCHEIVGMNVLFVATADEHEEPKFKGEKWRLVYDVFSHVAHQFDTYESYNIDKYLSAVGLSVHSDYRRRGIATEILKARIPLCKAFDIKVTTTVFTAIGSQMSAAKAGFVDKFSIDYTDLAAINEAYKFSNVKTKSIKLMCLEIE